MKDKTTNQQELQYCRKCLRKLSKKSERRFHLAQQLLHSLAPEPEKARPCGCFDVCPKKGLVLRYLGKKITMKL